MRVAMVALLTTSTLNGSFVKAVDTTPAAAVYTESYVDTAQPATEVGLSTPESVATPTVTEGVVTEGFVDTNHLATAETLVEDGLVSEPSISDEEKMLTIKVTEDAAPEARPLDSTPATPAEETGASVQPAEETATPAPAETTPLVPADWCSCGTGKTVNNVNIGTINKTWNGNMVIINHPVVIGGLPVPGFNPTTPGSGETVVPEPSTEPTVPSSDDTVVPVPEVTVDPAASEEPTPAGSSVVIPSPAERPGTTVEPTSVVTPTETGSGETETLPNPDSPREGEGQPATREDVTPETVPAPDQVTDPAPVISGGQTTPTGLGETLAPTPQTQPVPVVTPGTETTPVVVTPETNTERTTTVAIIKENTEKTIVIPNEAQPTTTIPQVNPEVKVITTVPNKSSETVEYMVVKEFINYVSVPQERVNIYLSERQVLIPEGGAGEAVSTPQAEVAPLNAVSTPVVPQAKVSKEAKKSEKTLPATGDQQSKWTIFAGVLLLAGLVAGAIYRKKSSK